MVARRLRVLSLVVLVFALASPSLVASARANIDADYVCAGLGYARYQGPDGERFTTFAACARHVAQSNDLVPVDLAVAPDPELTGCELDAIAYGVIPGNYTVVEGTSGDDTFADQRPETAELFCGFGGDDSASLGAGDVFIGGAGNDTTGNQAAGTFYGGEGDDVATTVLADAVFHGGRGNDSVTFTVYGAFLGGSGQDYASTVASGYVDGGDGDDHVEDLYDGGTFDGGPGNDTVAWMYQAGFNGGDGDDHVDYMNGTAFNGGGGTDTVRTHDGGAFND